MDRQELLQERYEDALFALLMDEVATSEGAKALEKNRRLRDDPGAQVPEEVAAKCMRTIRSHFGKIRRRAFRKFTMRAAGKVMMVIGVLSTLFFTAFAASETVRVRTLNLVMETFHDRTDFRFVEESESYAPQVYAQWLPDGYFLSDEESGKDDFNSWSIYRNATNGFVHIMYADGDGSAVSLDSEDGEVHPGEINGREATYITIEDEIQIIWGTEDRTAFIRVLGRGIPEPELTRIASSVKY